MECFEQIADMFEQCLQGMTVDPYAIGCRLLAKQASAGRLAEIDSPDPDGVRAVNVEIEQAGGGMAVLDRQAGALGGAGFCSNGEDGIWAERVEPTVDRPAAVESACKPRHAPPKQHVDAGRAFLGTGGHGHV